MALGFRGLPEQPQDVVFQEFVPRREIAVRVALRRT